jgi:outer membrane protein assembly factor BamB
MATEPQPGAAESELGPPHSDVPFLRIGLAWLITMVLLPYAWGRSFVFWLLSGKPEWWVPLIFALGVVAAAGLIWGRAPRLAHPRFHRWLFVGILIPWVVEIWTLVALYAGPTAPWYYVGPVFVLSTLWIPWIVWLGYFPVSWKFRQAVLFVLLVALVAGVMLITVDMTGAAEINFIWRWQARHTEGLDTDTILASNPIDLTPTDHDFAEFLGPERSAVVPNVRLARDWSSHPPRQVWRKPVGEAWSSFAVVGNYAITQEQRGDKECVVCYRLSGGDQVWVHADKARFDTSLGGVGPRATPTVVSGRVYTVGATGILNCLDGTTGRRIWSVNILDDNGAKNIEHGVCASPLVIEDRVIVCPTGSNGVSLAAYHKEDGRRLWQQGKDQASYGSPMLVKLAGVRQIVLYTSAGISAHDPATGQLYWDFPWTNSTRVNCAQPIASAGAPDRLFVSTGYGKGSVLIEVDREKDGSWAPKARWEKLDMKTKFTTPAFYQGFVYGLDDGILECVDVQTGKRRWKDGRYGHGQILLAGDLLLVLAEDGRAILVAPRPERLVELGRFQALEGKTWNNPALAGRYLLVRNDREAACYELALEAN